MGQLGDRADPPLSQLDDLPRLQPAKQGNIIGADRALPAAPCKLAGRTVPARQEFRGFRCREHGLDLVRRRARIARFNGFFYAIAGQRGLGEKIGFILHLRNASRTSRAIAVMGYSPNGLTGQAEGLDAADADNTRYVAAPFPDAKRGAPTRRRNAYPTRPAADH
jgi:hypothetical protein